jgi:uncharacterized protein YndB with AHSA1/START domain
VNRTVVHDTFVLERTYAASPGRVFGAWSNQAAKDQWFGPDEQVQAFEHAMDFRIGGRETINARIVAQDTIVTLDALYQDIVDGERIVYSYEMTMNGRRISVSVATVEFLSDPSGTLLILTEQGAYLDGLDTRAQREEGTVQLLAQLATYLEKEKS